MKKLYLITGATGHVGTVLLEELLSRGEQVRALVYKDFSGSLPSGVQVCSGDITDIRSLEPFFDRFGFDRICLIHCAGMVTIASKKNPDVWKTNVEGTRNIMELSLAHGVDRVIYVSTVHVIPERPKPEIITEVDSFSPQLVQGQYAESKAAATQIVLDYAKKGLNASVVHPSGIMGPGDTMKRNHLIRTIKAMAAGRISVGISGGYDCVDSRDVAKGILLCEKHGRRGECYILSGHYVTIQELLNRVRVMTGRRPTAKSLPYRFVKATAAFAEKAAALFGRKHPLITPLSVHTLHSNGFFSHEKARRELGYSPRPLEESIRASL